MCPCMAYVGFLQRHIYECACDGCADVLLWFWAYSEKMHEWICAVLCVSVCVRQWVTARMSASVSLFVSVLMNYVRHVQMSKHWCFGWGWRANVAEAQCLRWMCEARHRTTCMTDRHIRTYKATEPFISHVIKADGSAGKRMCKLNLL